jgi:hypothetical protein
MTFDDPFEDSGVIRENGGGTAPAGGSRPHLAGLYPSHVRLWRPVPHLRSGFRVQGSGCRVQGTGFRDQGSGFRVQGSGFRVQGTGFRVQGSGFRVQGSAAPSFRFQGFVQACGSHTRQPVRALHGPYSAVGTPSPERAIYDVNAPYIT